MHNEWDLNRKHLYGVSALYLFLSSFLSICLTLLFFSLYIFFVVEYNCFIIAFYYSPIEFIELKMLFICLNKRKEAAKIYMRRYRSGVFYINYYYLSLAQFEVIRYAHHQFCSFRYLCKYSTFEAGLTTAVVILTGPKNSKNNV